MSDVENVLAAALRLPTEARAVVAAELIESLDEPGQAAEDVEAAWGDEIRQRLAEVDAGVVTPIPWPEARRRIFAAAKVGVEPVDEGVQTARPVRRGA
jgi:putative addiction module component (TIGR02574 family)